MSEKYYSDWINYYDKIYDIINTTLEDNIIIIQPQEFLFLNLQMSKDINNELIKKNKKLTIYSGSEFDSNILCSNIEIIYWDSIDFNVKSQKFNENFSEKDNGIPTSLFASMCSFKLGRTWRFYIINEIFKNDLYKFGNYIFRIEDELKLENLKFEDINYIDFSKFIKFYSNKPWDWKISVLPEEYINSSFDIVIETLYDYFFVTEKTLRAIDTKKPFFVFSCFNFHNKLRRYGFELYDEIIDYSFDNILNTTDRFDAQIKELNKLSKYTPRQIYNMTKEKTDYNYNILSKLKTQKIPNIPDHIYDIIDEKYFIKDTDNEIDSNISKISKIKKLI